MRRVNCPSCGVKVEQIPWADGKVRIAKPFQLFLAVWAEKLSWKETAQMFHTSRDNVFHSVKNIVDYGLKHRNLDNIKAIGVDEVQVHAGQDYVTLVYKIDEGLRRLLYVAEKRTVKAFLGFFNEIDKERSQRENLSVFATLKSLELHCCIAWESILAQNLPTNSAEETQMATLGTDF